MRAHSQKRVDFGFHEMTLNFPIALRAHSSKTQIWLSRSDTLVCLCTLHAQSSSFRFQELTHILMS